MFEELEILTWPDPRLKKISQPITQFTPELAQLAQRMFDLMREHKGVGLAAAQVGQNIRMFVMNGTGTPEGDRVYINPVLSDPDGEEESEEGCLSLPNINAQISRNKTLRMQAQDLQGNRFDELQSGYIARIWQHETDHLNGVLITDRMGLGDKLKYRKTLRDLEEAYEVAHPPRKTSPRAKSK
ncbi:MAG TPA: peptide deformylase [Tepidisphaeraceae bacterium]|nr:peptide deformylase [Tepidisphaeraceae bacterium]